LIQNKVPEVFETIVTQTAAIQTQQISKGASSDEADTQFSQELIPKFAEEQRPTTSSILNTGRDL